MNYLSGRAKHFITVTDPRNLFASNIELEAAKNLVREYKLGYEPTGISDEQVWAAKRLQDSAFHPDTGEKSILIGRMSAQVPMNMALMGGLMTFYKTTPAIVFWQWINQSFMATVNYTNRSGDAPIAKSTLVQAYVSATGAALGVALGLNAITKSLPAIVGRLVPFTAVAAANCVNIPLMRQSELKNGVPILDENGEKLGVSKVAARKAIAMTVFSRIVMALPGMSLPPIAMDYFEKRGLFRRFPWLPAPLQIGMVGVLLVFATPLCCAIFPQESSISISSLEGDLQDVCREKGVKQVFFNKGL